jgi:FtsP/CotA-like multicopper oxidase with cupredoxin domain
MSAFTDGPAEARLGIVDGTGTAVAKKWEDAVTENPAVGATEVWEYFNTTADAHPMHIHEAAFQVVNRQDLALDENDEVIQPIQLVGDPTPPEPWENGWKDTVTAYPGQVTRLRLRFAKAGQFVWHCHIVEHEDNEMMRPYRIGPRQPGQPE